ncbi:MAG TPA: hypothetical protein VL402_05975 [Xanthobacteraceae bacterium]|jgi:hypothetical protein|nr:hypothetical protein [Xanthobacteraceae bacterium]
MTAVETHPDKPALTLVVGITGHRFNKLNEGATDHIERALIDVFAAIDAACASLLAQHPSAFASTAHRVRLVSGLAEGADQIAVAVRPQGWAVDAVLPFPCDRYAMDFAPDAATGGIDRRAEFRAALAQAETVVALADETDPPLAYQSAGEFLLRQSDLLVAIWDGDEKAGIGGTQGVVAHALDAGIPVIWIHAAEARAPALLRSVTDEAAPVEATPEQIAAIVTQIAAPPATGHHESGDHKNRHHKGGHGEPVVTAATRLADFQHESWKTACRWVLFDCLKRWPRVWTWRSVIPMRGLEDGRAEWEAFAPEASDGPAQQRFFNILMRRQAWADMLATYYAHVYRSTYVLTYLLSALAVAVAATELLPLTGHLETMAELAYKALFAALELVVVITVVMLVRRGRTGRWHERWLDYRALAEVLRHIRFLSQLGEGARLFRMPHGSAQAESWVLWYVRATCRELGLRPGNLDADFQRKALRALRRYEIDDQVSYHHANERTLHALDHRLHRLGLGCFSLTAILLMCYLALFVVALLIEPAHAAEHATAHGGEAPEHVGGLAHILEKIKNIFTFFDILLPALGASISGIRFTGEFSKLGARSAQTATALADIGTDIDATLPEPKFRHSLDILLATADVLSADVEGWQSLYSTKKLELPA